MACFTACVAEAIVAFGVKKTVEKNHSSLALKLNKLIFMLLAGSFLLLIEHVSHGKITYFYPFLTAMNDPEDTKKMLKEIVTVGGSMDLAVSAVWFFYYFVSDKLNKKSEVHAECVFYLLM